MTAKTFTKPAPLSEFLVNPQLAKAQYPATAGADMGNQEQNGNVVHGESSHPKGVTFAHQDKLPKLPIPDLESTVKNYLDVLKPLQNRREQHDTAAATEEFLRRDGPDLQARLKKYATGKTSYIEQFCMSIPPPNSQTELCLTAFQGTTPI